ncbi:hypothetical protein [Paracoccus sp. pheM1]|uniref:hypothetical protein n=1 Tax=Paracoccus sp. pheM1 TaxID=2831675 RepID=UPI001BDB8686|nr:hypothetical protein [Paracoccus sp. pheM1]MBT0780843.1 hypothetical protein [Paracoccus sp. pheM1]
MIYDTSEKDHTPDAVLHRDPAIEHGRLRKIGSGGPGIDKVVECGLGKKVFKSMIWRHCGYSVLASSVRHGRGITSLGGLDG